MNESILNHYSLLLENDIQVLWQSGKLYHKTILEKLEGKESIAIKLVEFIDRMDLAYALADVIISRAGAISVSELCLVKKPVILVPSPNVAEDHQTKNAMALVSKNAALLITDTTAKVELVPTALKLLKNEGLQESLSREIGELGKPNATENIVDIAEKIALAVRTVKHE